MKRVLLLIFAIGSLGTAYSQVTPLKKDRVVVSKRTNENIDPAILEYAKKNGSVIMTKPSGKDAKIDGTISMSKAELVDPVEMGFTIPFENKYYTIEGTDKMLMIKSLHVLQLEMKSNLK